MGKISSYATLTQAISDWTHRADLAANGFTDYFINAAQASIERDIPDLNFGDYIWLQEASYGPYPIVNGVTPVPPDFIGCKVMTLTNGIGTGSLTFKEPSWIYARYPLRQASRTPTYIAQDLWKEAYAQPTSLIATAGQTLFGLPFSPSGASLVIASLDGAVLTPNLSYTLSGANLTLTYPTTAGQILNAQMLRTAFPMQFQTASAGQTVFTLGITPTGPLLVSLDGAVLTAGVSYSVAGTTLTLAHGALAGQVLTVQVISAAYATVFTTMKGQSGFQLASTNDSVIFATLDGAMLTAGVDYTVADGFLLLAVPAIAGQTLTAYSDDSSVFIYGPYPDSDYTVSGTYYATAPILSTSQTSNWMVANNQAADVLLAACMVEAGVFLKDMTMVQTWESRYQSKLKALVDQDKAERMGGGPCPPVNVG